MKILFFAHSEILWNRRFDKLQWIQATALKLESLGFQITFFKPDETKIRHFPLVHIFSRCQGETWHWMKRAGLKTIVTPALGFDLPPDRSVTKAFYQGVVHGFQALSQRTLKPVNERYFLSGADHYLVPAESPWGKWCLKSWNLSRDRIQEFPAPPDSAAQTFAAAYRNVLPHLK
jgi:hypothetical protein